MNNIPPSFQPISGPRPGETAWLWLVKIITGPLLVVILALHLIVNHYLGSAHSGLMSYADIIAYYQNPIIPAIEILFVITVVTHSLIGLRGILLDMNPTRTVLTLVTWVLALLGIAELLWRRGPTVCWRCRRPLSCPPGPKPW